MAIRDLDPLYFIQMITLGGQAYFTIRLDLVAYEFYTRKTVRKSFYKKIRAVV